MKDRLYRSRVKRVFGGVAGGLAEYMNLDPILVRVLFIIIAAINGIGVLLYIIMWIVVPEAPFEYEFPDFKKTDSDTGSADKGTDSAFTGASAYGTQTAADPSRSMNSRLIIGIILIGFGTFFLLDNLFPFFDLEDVFPLALVVIGVALLWNSIQNKSAKQE
jgi:phage shock protein PspC (stress-responsive transcriptional regulator)